MRHVERNEHIPLRRRNGAELLAAGAGTAAHEADAVTNDVALGASLLAEVVTEDAASARDARDHQAVLNNSAGLAEGGSVELAGRAGAAAPPAGGTHEAALEVRGAAAGGHLPHLIEGASLASPVDLVDTKDALDATSLNLSNTARHDFDKVVSCACVHVKTGREGKVELGIRGATSLTNAQVSSSCMHQQTGKKVHSTLRATRETG